MNKIRTAFLFLIFYITFTWLGGQIPHFATHAFPENFGKIQINKILETKGGFVLFGTSQGLFEYDGQEFIPYLFNDSIPDIDVTALFEDKDLRVWIGTQKGAVYFINEKDQLEEWMPEEGTPKAKITGFTETEDGIFWVSTYGEGIYYFNKERLYNLDVQDGLIDNEIYEIAKHRKNHILVATDGGINVCKIKNGTKQIHQLTTSDGLSDEIIKTILSDGAGNFWAGTYDKGIDFWDSKTQTFKSIIPNWDYGEVNQLAVFENKELWIGTNGDGLFRFDFNTERLNEIDVPLFNNSKIFDLHKDVEGNLWVLNNIAGISSANRQFEQIHHTLGDIQAVLTDHRNRFWVGTPKGLFFMKSKGGTETIFEPFFQKEKINVISLYEDRLGFIWIGTFGQGLYCFDVNNNDYRRFSINEGLDNENILSITGSENQIWLATLGGVFEMDIQKDILKKERIIFRNYNHEDGLGTSFIFKVFLDSKNKTWFGTDGKGISVLDKGKITNYPEANGIPLKAVYAITEDQRGHIWFSTAEHGIFEFDGEAFHQLNIKEGIRDLEITGLATDDLGNIIIVHPSGIDVLNPVTKHLIYYDDEVGLIDMEPILNSVCNDKLGNIYLGVKGRIIRYSALDGYIEIHPRNQIKNVNVFFEAVDFKSVNRFEYTQNSLVFDYIGLWYSAPDKVEYRYQLEGYNPSWIYSKDQQAHYSDLKPGDYIFKVSSTENGAFDNEPIATYAFTIEAPFWQQAWFVVLTILFLGGLIYAWTKWKTNRLQREAAIQRERVESQLEVLKSQINPHFLFNSFNTLITLIEEEPASATVYVEKLSDFYRSLLQYRQKDLIPLQEELELLRNFSYLLKKRFGENIHLEIPDINGRAAFIPPLTLQMLVENAIKHNIVSKRKPLFIKLGTEDDKIFVSNNLQKKLTEVNSTQFGLQSIQSRFALLGEKQVEIIISETEYKVFIPIISSDK